MDWLVCRCLVSVFVGGWLGVGSGWESGLDRFFCR